MNVLGSSQLASPKPIKLRPSCIYAAPILRYTFSLRPTPAIRHHILRNASSKTLSKTPAITPPTRLKGATCMITGGASGIGFAIAQRFLRDGAGKIILVGRRKERLSNALDRLRGAYEQDDGGHIAAEYSAAKGMSEETSSGGKGSAGVGIPSSGESQDKSTYNNSRSESSELALIAGDVGNPSFWNEEVTKSMDNVDILINAAGVSRSSLLPLAKDEDIEQVLRTNLQGTIFACRAMTRRALRRQRKQSKPGDTTERTKCIINISSLHATKGGIGASTYASTKAGVIALTRAIAAEGSLSASGAKTRANVIVPGYINTEMLDEFSDSFRAEAQQSIPLKRFGRAEEVADAAAFLATNEYANNCVLNLDGGLSAM